MLPHNLPQRRGPNVPFMAAAGYAALGAGAKYYSSRPSQQYTYKANSSEARPSLAGKRKKRPRKPTSKTGSKLKQLEKAVNYLKKTDDNESGTLTYRYINSGSLKSVVNRRNYAATSSINKTAVENMIEQLKYYDPANPGTLLTASAASGTYSRDCLIESISHKLHLRNNYQTPVNLTVYYCTVKADTNIDPASAWLQGIVDQGYGNHSAIDPIVQEIYPSDSDQLNDLWKLQVAYKGELQPGQHTTVSRTVKDIKYSPSTADQHNLTYQKAFKANAYMIVIHGPLGHDTVQNEQTYIQSGIDYRATLSAKVKYNAGIDIKYYYIDQQQDLAFTNGGVVSQQPIADNQSYSIV